MPDSPEIQDLDIRKGLLFNLCQFLIDKRRTQNGDGIRTTIEFPINELLFLSEYISINVPQTTKIRKIFTALSTLMRDKDKNGRRILEVLNPEILDSFENSLNNGIIFKLEYTSENLELYQTEIKRHTEIARRAAGGIRITALPNGGVKISAGTREMKIARGHSNTGIPIGPYLIILLYGDSISQMEISIRMFSRISSGTNNDYKRGDYINFGFLQDLFYYIETGNDRGSMLKRKITDAIRGINKKSRKEENFGVDIFKIEEGTDVRWCL